MAKAKEKSILLTFDVEEFDLPHEYDHHIPIKWEYNISKRGLMVILGILRREGIKATFFVTALFAKKFPSLIKKIAKRHEIALHGYAHSEVYDEMNEGEILARLKKAKSIVERISGKRVISFRSQRLQKVDYQLLSRINLKVDNSLLPTYIPMSFTYTLGRIENLFKSRKVFREGGIIEVPLTVTPFIRLPLLWITFRNMPLYYAKICTALALINNNFVSLVFHPWEFIDISKLEMPLLIKNKTGYPFSQKIEDYIKWAKRKGYKFKTISEFLHEQGYLEKSCR